MRKLYTFLFFNLFALFASSVSYSQNADLSVSMTINNSTPYIGSNVVFTITASNNGPNNATGVIVEANLHSGYVYVSSTPQTGNYSVTTGIWAIGNLASGATGTLIITTTVLETGNHNFTACITGNETDLITSNNCSSVNPTVTVINPPSSPTIDSFIQPTCTTPTGTIVFVTQTNVLYSIGGAFQVSPIFTNVVPGSYILTVKSTINNSTASASNPFIVNSATPPVPTVASIVQPTCNNPTGTIIFTTQAGVEYSIGSAYQASPIFTNVASGTYPLSVRSTTDNTCTTDATSTVTINVAPWRPTVPTVASTVQPTCSTPTGTITFTTQTGVEYSIGSAYQASPIFTGVAPGTYTLSVRNSSDATCISNAASPVMIIITNDTITASAVATYVDYNNDGFVNVGDVINYQYTVANIGTCPISISNVQIANTNNFLILTGTTINTLGVGETNNTSLTATHVITQNEINAGNVHLDNGIFGTNYGIDVILNTSLNITDGIKLNAFIDTNGNGIQDGSEQNYPQANFNYQLNSGINNTVSSSTGNYYLYETNPSNLYNISCSLNSPYTSCGSQYTLTTSSYNNISVNVGSGITTLNFPITVVACSDISVNIYSTPNAVPGFNYYNNIYYKNNGTQTIPSGTITFTKDNAVSLISVSPSASTTTANGFTYDFTNLLPNEGRYIYVNMLIPTIPTVSLGQLVTNSVSITPPSGDINTLNNSSTLVRTIVGSYDPNEKSENHGGKILHSTFLANDFLTYTINFKNTGTANAINIKVSDVLDAKLDETTIKMVDASATYVLKRIGNNLTWTFSGINLPSSNPNSSTIGHGHITFQIKPKLGYAVGDIITNIANIYFDFNPAIVTNNCTTEFVATLENEKFAFNNLNYYPNPVKNSLTISNASTIDEVEITSVLGQKMTSKKVNNLQTEINLAEFTNGVYFVKITSNGQEKTIKIVKE